VIIFFDIWKSADIKDFALKNKFKQPRVGQWLKTNPVPINSKTNYLSNCSEYFFTFIKGKNPTFNSKYDMGIYRFPLCHGNERLEHPTQKPLGLIKELLLKHSNSGDLILDPFSGTSTLAVASIESGRNWICIERDQKYYEISKYRVENIQQNIET
jgi:site-specific DNA-methyltransferase (adenine-specific)